MFSFIRTAARKFRSARPGIRPLPIVKAAGTFTLGVGAGMVIHTLQKEKLRKFKEIVDPFAAYKKIWQLHTQPADDTHLHLSGSYSEEFLEQTAKDNGVYDIFLKFKSTRKKYIDLLAGEIKPETPTEIVDLIWQQFFLIDQIIMTLKDIQAGTIDVVKNSDAGYLEIRTTPKDKGKETWRDYAAVFVAGLLEANVKFGEKKVARGMLSLDRTKHTPKQAKEIIDYVAEDKTGMLVGIDISGNFLKERALTGQGLADTLNYALQKDIGIGIHLGETDKDIEVKDVDVILDVLEKWYAENKTSDKNPLHGKVRLGHGIHFTTKQRDRIAAIQAPIEVCPSCHAQLNWWDENKPHPVTLLYKKAEDPVSSGTDDSTVFGESAEKANRTTLAQLNCTEEKDVARARELQKKYRFCHLTEARAKEITRKPDPSAREREFRTIARI